MSIRPILFNTEMVRAIQDGRKTVTRRVIKPQPDEGHEFFGINCMDSAEFVQGNHCCEVDLPCVPGDILWVRETWSTTVACGLFPPWPTTGTHYIHKAELNPGHPYEEEAHWYPSIHMPKKAARIFLRVKSVRAERLQDISPKSAGAEGVKWETDNSGQFRRFQFSQLWDSTIKPHDLPKYGWAANPWVWVIEFERCEKPEGIA